MDREAINRWGVPVTTDRYVSMKLGSVTSTIYDLINSSSASCPPTFWSTHIAKDGHDVILIAEPSDTELSAAEEKLAEEVFEQNKRKDGFQLADE